jgi:DNA helicase II / ATP-dependent DNA helicase PcrA
VPLDPNDVRAAEMEQRAAARASAQAIRLVAGPGTGKSATIEERVRWLLEQGTPPDAIYVVSFTRASAAELRERECAITARAIMRWAAMTSASRRFIR